MKSLILSMVLGLGLVGATEAGAVYRPNWDRPVQSAEMRITSAEGVFNNVRAVTITETRRDGQADSQAFLVDIDGRVQKFIRSSAPTKDACRSTHYALIREFDTRVLSSAGTVLELVDHSTRVCKDLKPYRWEAKLRRTRFDRGVTLLGAIDMVGNPEPVFTPQTF